MALSHSVYNLFNRISLPPRTINNSSISSRVCTQIEPQLLICHFLNGSWETHAYSAIQKSWVIIGKKPRGKFCGTKLRAFHVGNLQPQMSSKSFGALCPSPVSPIETIRTVLNRLNRALHNLGTPKNNCGAWCRGTLLGLRFHIIGLRVVVDCAQQIRPDSPFLATRWESRKLIRKW